MLFPQLPINSSFGVPSAAPQPQNSLCAAFPSFLQHGIWINRRNCTSSGNLQLPISEILPRAPCQQEPRQACRNSGRQHHLAQVTRSCPWDSWRGHILNSFLKHFTSCVKSKLIWFFPNLDFWRQYWKLRRPRRSYRELVSSQCLIPPNHNPCKGKNTWF